MHISDDLNSLLAPRFLFRFALPLQKKEPVWGPMGSLLEEKYRLANIAELDAGTTNAERGYADFRMAWSLAGISFWIEVKGKRQVPWCRDGRMEDSDGLQVWIDTRATHNLHRATKYCHRFVFLPFGAGRHLDQPLADQLLINRARENARPVKPRELQVKSKVTEKGYVMQAFVPAKALEGYDPTQYKRLGFNYGIFDRELGMQTLSTGPAFPFDEDPSCWATMELVGKV